MRWHKRMEIQGFRARRVRNRGLSLPTMVLFALAVSIGTVAANAAEPGTRLARQASDAIAARGTGTPTRDPAACARRFHTALSQIGANQGDKLDHALASVRETDESVTPGWVFWSPFQRRRRQANGVVKPAVLDGLVCIRSVIGRGGRERCMKWAPATPDLIAELTRKAKLPDPTPDRRTLRDLRMLDSYVRNRGALVSFRRGGKFYFLAERIVDELKAYLTQPYRVQICSGVKTMLDFYGRQLALVTARERTLLDIDTRADGQLDAAKRALGIAAGGDAISRAPGQSSILVDIHHAMTGTPQSDSGQAAATLRERLKAIRVALDAIDASDELAVERRVNAINGLRAIEMKAALAGMLQKHKVFSGTVETVLRSIRSEHEAACGCQDRTAVQ